MKVYALLSMTEMCAHCGNNRCLLNRMLVCQILSAFCTEFLVRFVPLDQEMCHN